MTSTRSFAIVRLTVVGLMMGATQVASAAVQTLVFDNLDASSSTVPVGYGAFNDGVNHFAGFDWSNGPLAVADQNDFELNPFTIRFPHRVSSPDRVAFNFGGAALASVDAVSGSFTFVGAKFTAWFDLGTFGMPGGVQTLDLEGWKGGSVLFHDSLSLTPFAQSLVSENWSGIDRLVLKTTVTFEGQTRRPLQWMMDYFHYSLLPEPGSILQLGIGLLILCAASLRRRPLQ